MSLLPLVVDLDGTLIRTDMLHESALRALRDKPWDVVRIPYWLSRGKAVLKQRLAQGGSFDASSLPYAPDLLAWLKVQKAEGRQLVLCTASDLSIATAIAAHLDIFDAVMASDGVVNLAGPHKAEALEQRFGRAGFDYAGNSHADLAVWARARRAVVVNASADLATKAAAQCEVERVFEAPAAGLRAWRRVLRVHQWMKNLLLFVPLLAAHLLTEIDTWLILMLAFAAFSLCASSVYIANDLLDLESDRQHPRKSTRPFAAGVVPAWMGVLLAPLLLAASILLASYVGSSFLACMVVYFLLTCIYSWGLKRLVLVDCVTLAILYTLRIIAGAAAAEMPLSFWLLAFSVFLFLSLAFVKRYAELQAQMLSGKEKVHGRGYLTTDAPLIQMLGITSGYASVVVLALYLNSAAVLQLYRTPEFVWGAVPVMLFWVSWIWLRAHRGDMHDDPLVFAVKDKVSIVAGLVFGLVLAGGALGWSW
ncbi:UbiA family prenyltransferase [Janthinobacterium psychrotolerans]|uniref:4-hydroxybenzoate polyprenyltransferase n=1 Tax=Janthinobacterium psychrotolerans TaxID=1747903 RepID=A0A1A7BVV7_9BURK|nr:UbiA family prenyltransferase [Janthinobacterium psychrotolerans]OBV37637.1 4-hydroxybenzoate polyprenyltransferase [Janthinobacterium psychrotolerans]